MSICGLDFGTSNTTLGTIEGQAPILVALEAAQTTIPSAMFYETDGGEIHVQGRLSPFIELGVGFNPDLTARDNAVINAIMLGLSRKQAQARLDDMVAFAELEDFMDLKLKNYSSGMHVRLAFSVAIQVDADILLIDEVLAVGDAAFQQKCYDQFVRLKQAGKTILFVTHDMSAVERFCDRAMLLERGRVLDIGQPSSIARQYNEQNFRRMRQEAADLGGPETLLDAPVAKLLSARFERDDGEQQFEMLQGEPCCIRLEVYFHADATDPIFAVALHNDRGNTAFAASTQLTHGATGQFAAARLDRALRNRLRGGLPQLARPGSLPPNGLSGTCRRSGRRIRRTARHQLCHRPCQSERRGRCRPPPHVRNRPFLMGGSHARGKARSLMPPIPRSAQE